MASKFKDTFLTNEFVTSVTDAIATGKNITLTQAVGSSTIYTDDQLKNINYSQSQSANKEAVTVINSPYRKQDNNTIVIEINLSNEQVNADFQIASILIYGQYNGNNILVGVARLNTPELFPAYDGKSIVTTSTDVFIAIDKVGTVNIAVSAAGLATADSVQQLRKYVDNDFDATIARLNRDNNFLNSNSFAKAINALAGINGALNTRTATFTDFADVAANMQKYAGNWFVGNVAIANSPSNSSTYYNVEVVAGSSTTNGYIKITNWYGNRIIYSTVTTGKLTSWITIANDSTVIHNTGNETADGIKTFIKQIIASAGVKGNLQGNADTATKFNATHKIGGVAFDGGYDINLPGVNLKGTQDTSGKAATAGVADSAAKADKLTTGAKINGTNFDGTTDIQVPASNDAQLVHTSGVETVGGSKTFTDVVNAKSGVVGNITGNVSGTSSKLATARKIAGVPFDGSSDIDLAGVNKIGNQDTTGNAASATTLLTQDIYGDQDLNDYVNNGIFSISGASVTNSPTDTKNWLTLVVFRNLEKTKVTVSQLLFGQVSNNLYTRNLYGTTWTNWVKVADDSTVLHNSGAETVKDVKTFLSQIVASAGVKGNLTGNADTATRLATARQIGGVSFNGTADIVLAGVNAKGNQDTSGNADTATTLKYQALADGVDLNTVKTAGLYGIGAASSIENTPVSRYFLMEVIALSPFNLKQTIYDTNSNNIWVRSMNNSGGVTTFTSWEMLGLDDTLLHNSGDESASGTKTFTGTIVANNPIQGNTIRYSILDGYDLNGYTGTGDFIINGAKNLVNYPDNASTYASLHVEKINSNTSIQTLTTYDNKIFTRFYGGTTPAFGDWISNRTVISDQTIKLLGINIRFYETNLGVNVLYSGNFNQNADGVWHSLGNMPSGITRPVMDNVSNSVQWGGIGGVTLRIGVSLLIKFSPDGSISYKMISLKENDNKGYQISIGVDGSNFWIK